MSTTTTLATEEAFENSLPAAHLSCDGSSLAIAARILAVIDRYGLKRRNEQTKAGEGALKFLAIIYGHVQAKRPIPMCLPAFPFKSPNKTSKVLGTLPDGAEALALQRLNGLCQAIGDLYPPGAKLTIISDGLVYNDLLGVPDKDVWSYGEALRALAITKECTDIEFARLRDLVSLSVPEDLDEMTYVANASNFRRALLNTFGNPGWDWKQVSQSEDVCLTYRGYIKFLETDLADVYPLTEGRSKSRYKRGIEYIAREMMGRGDAFASAVRQRFKDHVRLSIHPSTGATKVSISLLPTDSSFTTPWHSCIAYRLDGTVTSGMRCDLEKDPSLELVWKNGQPSYFREKSDLLHWEEASVVFEPLYPSGWMVRPVSSRMSIEAVNAKKVRALAEVNSPVVMRGFFKTPKQDAFIAKSREFGEPLPWKFGLLLEVKDRGADTRGLNNVLSAEWMPFHYDGLFKTTTQIDDKGTEIRVSEPPRFQFFAGATASPKDTGFTLFSSSTMVFKYMEGLSVEDLAQKTWTVSTSSFDQTKLDRIPLVAPHPTTGKRCLRYHEPWPSSKTSFDATYVTIDGEDESTSDSICRALDSLLHDRRVAYYHSWEKGDLVVSDNVLMMHTRSDFTAGCDRELWRIHFD